MAMAPDFPNLFSFGGVFSRRRLAPKVKSTDHQTVTATCARREFLNRVMCENAGAIEGEFGMQAMMSMYPREF